ncbi:uncharacterized protein LOC121876454 isoform X2 [Homarus americanus]|uniref:uncharacterized protein LOC121876454 isoform X2 n=1 Tax=Homarus americanus TaxID=6706 RepID=UPI001C465CB6|nr:uncharacterized protein LOC121876454 isoform X2 [Homarus americanus]
MKPMTVWATVGVIISITTLTHVTHARQAFKGDPGELGDPGFDLSRYAVSQEVKSRTKRYYLTFPSSSTLTFNNKIKIPLFSKFDSNIKGVFKGFIRAIYTLPSEIVSVGRSQIDQDRVVTYNSLESVFTKPTHGLNTSKDELHDHCIAESYGRDIGHCDLAYSSCPFNLGQLLTTGLSLLEGSLSGFPQA